MCRIIQFFWTLKPWDTFHVVPLRDTSLQPPWIKNWKMLLMLISWLSWYYFPFIVTFCILSEGRENRDSVSNLISAMVESCESQFTYYDLTFGRLAHQKKKGKGKKEKRKKRKGKKEKKRKRKKEKKVKTSCFFQFYSLLGPSYNLQTRKKMKESEAFRGGKFVFGLKCPF